MKKIILALSLLLIYAAVFPLNDDYGFIAENTVREAESRIRMFEATQDAAFLAEASAIIDSIMAARDDARGVNTLIDSSGNALCLPLWSSVKFSFLSFDLRNLFAYFSSGGRSSGSDMLCRFSPGRFLAVTKNMVKGQQKQDTFIVTIDSTSERTVLRLYNNKKWDYFAPDMRETLDVCMVKGGGIIPERDAFSFPMMMTTALVSSAFIYYIGEMDRASLWGDSIEKRSMLVKAVKDAVSAHMEEYDAEEGLFRIRGDISGLLIPRVGYRPKDPLYSYLPWNMQFCMGMAFARAEKYCLLEELGWTGMDNIPYGMADAFMHNLRRSGLTEKQGFYEWKYNSEKSYDEPKEDILHGFYDIFFLNQVYMNQKNSNRMILTRNDMKKFARSFIDGFFPKGMRYRTDVAEGEKGVYSMYTFFRRSKDRINAYRHWAAFWSPLCVYDPRVYEIGFNTNKPGFKRGESFLKMYADSWKPWSVDWTIRRSGDEAEAVKVNIKNISVVSGVEAIIEDGEGKRVWKKTVMKGGETKKKVSFEVSSSEAGCIRSGEFYLIIRPYDEKLGCTDERRIPLKKYHISY